MFSDLTLAFVKRWVSICTTLNQTPYKWDPTLNSFQVAESIPRKIAFYFAYLQAFSYFIFLILRLIDLIQSPEVNFVSAAWISVWINFYLWAIVTFRNGHIKKWETVSLFRGLQKVTREFQQENNGITFPPMFCSLNLLDFHIVVAIWVIYSYKAAVALMFAANPNGIQFINSLISINTKWNSWQFFIYLAFEIYSKAAIGGMLGVDGWPIFTVLVSTGFWLEHFRKSKMGIPLKIQNYRKLQILITYFNLGFTWLLIPILFVWIPSSLAITCGFSAIRFHSFLPFFEYLPFPAIFINMILMFGVTFVPAAKVFDSSERMWRDLKIRCTRSSKLHRKQVNSLRPFGVRVGPIQVIRRVGILLCYYFISNNVFTLLITFPQDVIKY